MADNSSILSDFGINILEEEIDDVIFQTNEFLCDATFTGSNGPFWWLLNGIHCLLNRCLDIEKREGELLLVNSSKNSVFLHLVKSSFRL